MHSKGSRNRAATQSKTGVPGVQLAEDIRQQLADLNGRRCILEDRKKYVGSLD